MSIHHAVAKKAQKLGVTLTETADGYTAAYGQTVEHDASATVALDKLLKALKASQPKQPRAKRGAAKKGKKRKAKKADDEDEEETEEGDAGKSIVKKKYKVLYRPTKDTNGDDFAEALHACLFPDGEEFDMAAFNRTCRENSISEDKIKKWGKLKNNGMRRMNAANVLRGMIRRNEQVKLGARYFKGSLKSLPKRKD